MAYTVHETARLAGTTVKTLYHYHKIGLLNPESIAENGYRYYGVKELERLQQIMFFRELDFSLKQIMTALENEPNRLQCLYEQQSLLNARRQRLSDIIRTLDESILLTRKGESMSAENMFNGLNQAEWEKALEDQNDYLKETYDYQLDTTSVDIQQLNKNAAEALSFIAFMAAALRNGIRADDNSVYDAIEKHISFLKNDHAIDSASFAVQSRFFLQDDFHRNMLESQQIGLSYFMCVAAESYAETNCL
jgi:DNA-binding transcriptional MerR regulator